MRMTQAMVPTLRSVPAEAEIISHQLLLRAGFIRKTASRYVQLHYPWAKEY